MLVKNNTIEISSLGEEKKFISGHKYWMIEWAKYKNHIFKIGDVVSFYDHDDNEQYCGEIDYIIYVEDNSVEVSIKNTPLGRIDIESLDF